MAEVYKIIDTRDPSDCLYVGSTTTGLRIRWRHHKHANQNTNVCQHLMQNGFENFDIVSLENCPVDVMRIREQHYMNVYKPPLNTIRAHRTKQDVAEKNRRYYEQNRVRILNQHSVRVRCECGRVVAHAFITKHRRNKAHKNIMLQRQTSHDVISSSHDVMSKSSISE